MEDGSKVRIARGQEASGAIIPRPEILKERRKPRPTIGTSKNSLQKLYYNYHFLLLLFWSIIIFIQHGLSKLLCTF